MKYYKLIGTLAVIMVIGSCFLNWTYYPDLDKHFNGFFSEENVYGKPAKFIIFLAVVSLLLIYIDKIWAKRTMLFVSAVNIAYLIRTYSLYTDCYHTICPEKQIGLYLLIAGIILLTITAAFPNMKLNEVKQKDNY